MKSLRNCLYYSRKPLLCLEKFAAFAGTRAESTVSHSFRKANVYDEFATEVEDEGCKIKVDARPPFAFFLSQAVEKAIAEAGVGNHPGKRKLNDVLLPDDLVSAVNSILQGFNSGQEFTEKALRLKRQIQERQLPLDPLVEEQKKREFMEQIIAQEPVNLENEEICEEDEQVLLEERKRKLVEKIRSSIYNFKFLDFSTSERACLYMMARLVPDYAALVKTFHQLRCALPHFQPTTVLDYGSGVGSVTWAVDATWPKTCKEMVNIDCSSAMHELHELLLKGGVAERPLPRRQNTTYFKRFMPLTGSIKHSLVVSSRSFLDLDNRDMRLKTLDILWKTVMPGGCLVLVENGRAAAGCTVMLEAREFLLRGQEGDPQSGRTRGIIVAPCPHQMRCPLLLKQPKYRICADSQTYMEPRLNTPLREVFSYLIAQKPVEPSQTGEHLTRWPRVVQPVIKANSVLVRVCNEHGNLQELSATKGKHGTKCRQMARKCKLGDLFPVEVLHPEHHISPGYNRIDLARAGVTSWKEITEDMTESDEDAPRN